jgi:hypothetical protein
LVIIRLSIKKPPQESSMPITAGTHWKTGDAIVLRGVWHSKFWWACPATIVHDTPELIALFWRAGTPNRVPATRPTPRDLLSNEMELIPHQWVDTDVLMLVTPGAVHSVNLMWEAGQAKVRCWYVDLLEPLRRTSIGFDSMDHLLDVVINADRSGWRWKDEDEFEQAVALGVYTKEEADAIRAEGEQVIARFQAGRSPFWDDWEKWTPPVRWEIPSLPDEWDQF